MITIQHCIDNKIPVDQPLLKEDRIALLKENVNADYSYKSLLKEVLSYPHTTVETLLTGWGGIQLVALKNPKKYGGDKL